jgi:signal transduction histidine kinase
MAEPTLGVRVRATLTATAIVAVTLVIALLAIGLVTRARLTATAEDRAGSRADAVAALVEAGVARDPLSGRNPDLLAQVISDGSVVAADAGASGLAPFSAIQPSPGETILLHVEAPAGIIDDDGLPERGPWVLAMVGTSDGTTVIAGTPLDEAAEVFGAAAGIVGLGVVALLVVVAAATWRLTGRALLPVDRMRAEADQISEGALDRRLAVPHTGDEIARLAVTLNDMLQRLDEAATARRRFVADASHELRSPVAAMRAMLEVTGDGAADRELLEALGHEVDRLDRLVADLLMLARSSAAGTRPAAEVDVDQLLLEEARAMRRRSARDVDTSAVSAARIVGDADAMARLLRNLADNALQHAMSRVWLTSRTEGSLVIIGVDDDGEGVARGDRERVFERFVRLDAARDRASGGSGLGLAVVRAVAATHGGEVLFVEPRHGGASVEVRLPAAPD